MSNLAALCAVQHRNFLVMLATEALCDRRVIRDVVLVLSKLSAAGERTVAVCRSASPRCRRWFLGIQAQMMREWEMVARLNGKPLEPCGESCRLPAERRRRLKLALGQSAAI